MRALTDAERCALVEVGPAGEGPVPDSVFDEFEKLGWGFWGRDHWWSRRYWHVTAAGRYALELDTLARQSLTPP